MDSNANSCLLKCILCDIKIILHVLLSWIIGVQTVQLRCSLDFAISIYNSLIFYQKFNMFLFHWRQWRHCPQIVQKIFLFFLKSTIISKVNFLINTKCVEIVEIFSPLTTYSILRKKTQLNSTFLKKNISVRVFTNLYLCSWILINYYAVKICVIIHRSISCFN